MDEERRRPNVTIEAPSAEQVAAAKQMRRDLTLPRHEPISEVSKRQVRSYSEGVLLMLMGGGIAWSLSDLGDLAWILAALLAVAGLLVIARSHGR